MSVLADHVPPGSRLVLSGRDAPLPALARLRRAGRMLEIGPCDLALTHEEASSLLHNAGVQASDGDVAELHRRTEGWPAGLYLAALGLKEGSPVASAANSFGGADRLVSEYMQSEFLARLSLGQRVFLTRTAVLERTCGPLCEAVLDPPGAAATLALWRVNLLLCLLTGTGSVTATTGCSGACCSLSCAAGSRRLSRSCGAAPPGRARVTTCPRRRSSTPSRRGTSISRLRSCANSGCGRPPAGPGRRRPAVAPLAGGPGRADGHLMVAVLAGILSTARGRRLRRAVGRCG